MPLNGLTGLQFSTASAKPEPGSDFRIYEPCYVGAIPAMNTFFVGLDVAFVALKAHASFREFVDGALNIVNGEVEYGEGCRDMVRLGMDQHLRTARKLQVQQTIRLGNPQPERSAVEFFGAWNVVYGKPTECLTFF